MVFSSIPFLFYFFPLFLLCYYILPWKGKNFCLLLFSLVFYAWGEPKYIGLLLLSSIVDYTVGRGLQHFQQKNGVRRALLITSLVVNLGLLSIYKYLDLFIGTWNELSGGHIRQVNLALPIGISFFTFQTMSYSIDVYRRKVEAQKNFIDYMTYVSMFPQLVAGPIVRYETIARELKNRTISFDEVCFGFQRFLMGLFKKVLIANGVGALWDATLAGGMEELSFASAWLGAIAFTLQIYFDFSGYSDMAIGMGEMMGFHFLENFRYPYMAVSIKDFWSRWHMSLSGWFKDYVYIPLGGSRRSVPRNILNLFIVWSLTGFWHGASWNFLVWGLYFGVLLTLEKYILPKLLEKMPGFLQHLYALFFIVLGWVIFAVEDFSAMGSYLKAMFGMGNGLYNDIFFYHLKNYGLVLALGILFSMPVYSWWENKQTQNKAYNVIGKVTGFGGTIVLLLMTISCLVQNTYNPFLYFRF